MVRAIARTMQLPSIITFELKKKKKKKNSVVPSPIFHHMASSSVPLALREPL